MPLLAADSFAYQFYREEKPQNDRSPCIDTEGSKCPKKKNCRSQWKITAVFYGTADAHQEDG
jgi:hypothetical protein